jgi:hypothetical protein
VSITTDHTDEVVADITAALVEHYEGELRAVMRRTSLIDGMIVVRLVDLDGFVAGEFTMAGDDLAEQRRTCRVIAADLADGRHPAHEVLVNAAPLDHVEIRQRRDGQLRWIGTVGR